MSNQSHETLNLNLLGNTPAEGLSGEPGAGSPEVDGASFAAQLSGANGGDFIVPTPRKKLTAGMIAFVAISAVAAGGLWWMHQRTGGPSPAEAADANVDAARASIQQFLADGSGSVAEMKALLADSEQITDKFASYSENRQVPLEEVKTNPFYMEVEDEEAIQDVPAVDLTRQQQEERARREAERNRAQLERLTAEAAKLEVQTIFFGKNPTALIDGKICRVGQEIGEFTIAAIHADAVELRNGTNSFEVKLKR